MGRIYSIILSVAAAIIALDQYTKNWALEYLTFEGQTKPFLGWFNFTLVHNPGAAFGILRGLGEPFRTWFFYLLPFVVLFFLWFSFVRKLNPKESFIPLVMGLVVGGAIGNFFDRIRFGYVIDFIDWNYPSTGSCIPLFYHMTPDHCHWPKFNIADSAITCAAILLIFHSIFLEQKQKKK